MQKSGHMVLKGVNRVHNDKIGVNGLERSQLCTQCKNQVKWSWKELICYTMIKLGQMVLEGVNYAHNDKIISVLYERPNQNERFLLNNMFLVQFQWNALCISLCISVKCAAHFTAHFTAHWNAQWNAQVHEMRSAFQWNAQRNSVKCTAFFDELLGSHQV